MQRFHSRVIFSTVATVIFTVIAASSSFAQHYQQTNLVSDLAGMAAVQDPNLVNPWGLTRSSSSPWWVADNGTGKSTLYNGAGAITPLVVTIPSLISTTPATPTGVVFNGTSDFKLPTNNNKASFIFVTEQGTVAGWNGGANAVVVVNQSPHSVFKGATLAQIGTKNYLYVADFRKGEIDVFDATFTRQHLRPNVFEDHRIPHGYAPFNVQNIGGNLYVTYALRSSSGFDEVDGPGLGYVDVYSPRGELLQRLEHGRWLNAPWGIALAPSDFGKFSHQLLVGQFGSGKIAAYDPVTGNFLGFMLKDVTDGDDDADDQVVIDGLWALVFGSGATNSGPLNTLFFTAGIQDEQHGLFGTLKPVAAELTQGSEQ